MKLGKSRNSQDGTVRKCHPVAADQPTNWGSVAPTWEARISLTKTVSSTGSATLIGKDFSGANRNGLKTILTNSQLDW